MIINLYKFQLFFIFLISTLIAKSQVSDGLRVGVGVGGCIYLGTQMDGKISFNTSDKSEFNLGFNFQLHKKIDYKNEIGFRYLNTELWSFKNDGYQALSAKISEFAFLYQRSLNGNSDLYGSKFNFTHNFVAGLSLISFNSSTYLVNPDKKFFKLAMSIGNGLEANPAVLTRPDPQLALGGILGYNMGVRLSNTFSLYLENTFTLSTSNYINGNLLSKLKFLGNGYTYSALTLYVNLNPNGNRLGCPKF